MKLSCIAVDDEPLALEKMETYIAKVDYLDLRGTFDNAFDALNFLRQERVDLMFLDIQMDELTGIQLLEVLKNQPKVILTTAYDQYALRGYELDVVDYLLKPFSFQRFLKAAEKVFENVRQVQQPTTTTPASSDKDFILVRSEYRLQKIKLQDIQYIEGMKDYSRIFTPTNKIMTLQNLKKLEEVLPCPPFLRVHKSFIISVDRVDSIGKNDIVVAERTIPIGGLYKKTFLDYLDRQKLIG
ncbi:MAG: LytTR family DNA-binding domain-containing protein [Saprospiraceae bacterium]|nr:LytTR family DNA-binding domain-containing protein [Saprospiraceae bacterium]